ncbi:MAG: MarR family winged helix-turn-helix transcriptional regulator [Proteocatella sp.]
MDEKNIKNLSEQFFQLIMQLHKKVLKPEEFMKGLPIPPSHAKVIFYLSHKGSTPVSVIAKELLISKPNMTPIIDKLFEEGYVNRYEDSKDRRILRVEVTEKAKDILKLKKELAVKSLISKLSELEDEDIYNLNNNLESICNILKKLN